MVEAIFAPDNEKPVCSRLSVLVYQHKKEGGLVIYPESSPPPGEELSLTFAVVLCSISPKDTKLSHSLEKNKVEKFATTIFLFCFTRGTGF